MTSKEAANATNGDGSQDYLSTINRCLEHKSDLLAVLSDVTKVSPWLCRDRQTTALKSALERGATASEFVSDSQLASSLPLVLMMGSETAILGHDVLVQRTGNYLQHAYRRRWIWQVLSYPIVLIVAYVVTWIVLSITLLPSFRELYDGVDLTKVPSTQRWIESSERWITDPIGAAVRTLAYCVFIVGLIKALPYALEYGSNWRLIGDMTRSSKRQLLAMARFTGTLASLLRIGAPIPAALKVSGLASGYYLFRSHAAKTADAWSCSPPGCVVRLPNCFPEMLNLALHSPRAEIEIDLIEKLSTIYTHRFEQRIELGRNLAGPVATLIGGALIGGLYASLIRPLIQLITSLA